MTKCKLCKEYENALHTVEIIEAIWQGASSMRNKYIAINSPITYAEWR